MTKENPNELCSVCEEALKRENRGRPKSYRLEMYCDHDKEKPDEVMYFWIRQAQHN